MLFKLLEAGNMKMIIFGATSAIAQAVAREVGQNRGELFLVGRNQESLQMLEADLRVRGAGKVGILAGDWSQGEKFSDWVNEGAKFLSGLDVVLIAHGNLPDQVVVEKDPKMAVENFYTNFVSAALLAEASAHYFERGKRGIIAVIGSVAGDRGRQSNYYYGAAKGGLELFLQGLRNRLYPLGVSVITIKPGFVSTPMTAHLKRNFLFASPERIARGILEAIRKKRDVVSSLVLAGDSLHHQADT